MVSLVGALAQAGNTDCGPIGTNCLNGAVVAAGVIFLLMIVVMVVGFSVARRRLHKRLGDRNIPSRFSVEPLPGLHMPDATRPWPDQKLEAPNRLSPSDLGDAQQVRWGEFRLFYDDGQYFFSRESGHGQSWLPVGAIPKNHRVVVDESGVPVLERTPVPHRRD